MKAKYLVVGVVKTQFVFTNFLFLPCVFNQTGSLNHIPDDSFPKDEAQCQGRVRGAFKCCKREMGVDRGNGVF